MMGKQNPVANFAKNDIHRNTEADNDPSMKIAAAQIQRINSMPTPTLKGSAPFIISTVLFIPFMLYFGKVVIDNNLYASIQYNKCEHLAWRAYVEIDRLENAHPELEHRVSNALEDAKKHCKDNTVP